MSDKEFKIKRSITEDDIPSVRSHVKSKYEPIYKSCKTLEKGEGVEIEVGKTGVAQVVRKGLKKRYPRRTFEVVGRSHPKGYHLYILRK